MTYEISRVPIFRYFGFILSTEDRDTYFKDILLVLMYLFKGCFNVLSTGDKFVLLMPSSEDTSVPNNC